MKLTIQPETLKYFQCQQTDPMYSRGMELIVAIVGSLLGGGLSILTAIIVFRRERKAKEAEEESALRRTLAVALVRSVLDLRECQQNPSANAHRSRDVHSLADANLVLFRANLDDPYQSDVGRYVQRVYDHVSTGASTWSTVEGLQLAFCEPLLKWSASAPMYSNSWFSDRAHTSPDEFTPVILSGEK